MGSDDALVLVVTSAFEMQGLDHFEAAEAARELVDQAKADSEAAGTGHPPGFGDLLAELDRDNLLPPEISESYNRRRAEGVTDADLRWFWNCSDVERRVMDRLAEQAKFAHFMDLLDEVSTLYPSLSREEAGQLAGVRLRKSHAVYGEPSDQSLVSGDDRPLPPELKDRVDRYLQGHVETMKLLLEEVHTFSSFNAWVRTKMQEGAL